MPLFFSSRDSCITAQGKHIQTAAASPRIDPSMEYTSRICLRQKIIIGGKQQHSARFKPYAASRSLQPHLANARCTRPCRRPQAAAPLLRSNAFRAGIKGTREPHRTVALSMTSKSSQMLSKPVLHDAILSYLNAALCRGQIPCLAQQGVLLEARRTPEEERRPKSKPTGKTKWDHYKNKKFFFIAPTLIYRSCL